MTFTLTDVIGIIWTIVYFSVGFYMANALKAYEKNGRDAEVHTILFWPIHVAGMITFAIAHIIGRLIDNFAKK